MARKPLILGLISLCALAPVGASAQTSYDPDTTCWKKDAATGALVPISPAEAFASTDGDVLCVAGESAQVQTKPKRPCKGKHGKARKRCLRRHRA